MANILLVDDSRTSRKILKGILESDGHVVIGEAKNGKEGVELYNQLKPDVVTMDVTMPIMDGLEALKIIKSEHPEALVVMITAAGQKSKMVEAVQSGANDFVSKPFDEVALKEVIKNLL